MRTKLDIEIWVTINAHESFWEAYDERLKAFAQATAPIYLLHKDYKDYKEFLPHFPTFEKWYAVIKEIGNPRACNPLNRMERPLVFSHWKTRYNRVHSHIYNLYKEDTPSKPKRYRYRYGWCHELKSRWAKQFEPNPEKRAQAKEAREQKKLWRRQLGKDKELRRKNCWIRNPGRFYKRLRASTHRAFTKKMLKEQKYEAFWPGEYGFFVDRWTWD